jgi:SAM-dependent methyltransferase
MNAAEFEALAAVECTHWFYRGKRRIVLHWLERLGLPSGSDQLIVDVGAGTGILLGELQAGYRALGVEYSPVGLTYARTKTTAPLLAGSAKALPLAGNRAGAAIALDVIEHIDDDYRALDEIARVVRPGGFVIISVPAFQSLWSDWDIALGHFRRYTRGSLLKVVDRCHLAVRHLAYINWLAFLPILVYRRWRFLFPSRGAVRLEDNVPPAWLNRLLEASFVGPACWPWFKPPAGVSLFCVLEKSLNES